MRCYCRGLQSAEQRAAAQANVWWSFALYNLHGSAPGTSLSKTCGQWTRRLAKWTRKCPSRSCSTLPSRRCLIVCYRRVDQGSNPDLVTKETLQAVQSSNDTTRG